MTRATKLLGSLGLGIASGVWAAVAIDPGTKYQKMSGFGASTAWASTMSDADADLLWSTTSGAGLSLHRIRIDPNSGSSGELSIAKKAVSRGAKVWATPWTPPAKFKSNNSGVMGTLTKPADYAQYLVGFVKTMKNNGVDIYAISAQNEPDAKVEYESCQFDGSTMAAWVGKSLGPAFAGTGVKVMAPETQNWWGLNTFWPLMKADADFMKYADILATHLYGGNPGDATFANTVNAIKASGKEFWQTEIYDTQGPADPGMGSALRTYKLMHECLTIANMSAWHFWWVYPSTTDNGALWDKATNKATKRLWVMGNFSRFVRPGFVRVAAPASPASGVTLSAYLSDKGAQLVVVAANTNTSASSQTFTVTGGGVTKVSPWITDDSRNLVADAAVAPSGNGFTYSLPPKSVTTLVVDLATTGVQGRLHENDGLRVVRAEGALEVALPSRDAGRVEVRTPEGRILEARDFPAGTSAVRLAAPRGGLLLVELAQAGQRRSVRVISER